MHRQRRVIRRNLLIVGAVYLLGSFLAGPLPPWAASSRWHFKVGPLYVGRPVTFTGDSPHYLLIVNSLIEDADVDLGNNQRQVREGDWDAGTRYRALPFGHHVDVDRFGRALSIHPPFMPGLLSLVLWPFQGSEWVESLAVYLCLLVVLGGIYAFMRWKPQHANWGLVLGLGSPLFWYGRDLWTEPWHATLWVLLLACPSLPLLAVVAMYGTLIKYTFVLVLVSMGAVDLWQGKYRRGLVLWAGALGGLLTAFLWAQYTFRFTDHFDLFHMAFHGSVGAYNSVAGRPVVESGFDFQSAFSRLAVFFGSFSGRGVWGLLFSPSQGLLPFFPIFAWGLWSFRKGGRVYIPAMAYFLLHASYLGWSAGTGFSARYLVPVLPVLVLGVAEARRRPRWLFGICLVYSVMWGLLAGLLPVAVVERGPVEVLLFLARELGLGSEAVGS